MNRETSNKNKGKDAYSEIPIPKDKNKKEYTTEERRAYIVKQINKKGGWKKINKTKIAEEFDVHRNQIYDDKKRILENENIDLKYETNWLLTKQKRALKKAEENQEWSEMSKIATRMAKMLKNLGVSVEKQQKQIQKNTDTDIEVNFETIQNEEDEIIEIEPKKEKEN